MSGSGGVSPNSGVYAYGNTVILQATPATGWKFDHWDGGATGTTNPTQITMTGDITVNAYFVSSNTHTAPEAYNLTVTAEKDTPVGFLLVGTSTDNSTLQYTRRDPAEWANYRR